MNIYACLCGEWINLTKEESARIGEDRKYPNVWFEENAELWSPANRTESDSYYYLDYVKIWLHDKMYRINPIFIQIVYD